MTALGPTAAGHHGYMRSSAADQRLSKSIAAVVQRRREYLDEAHLQIQNLEEHIRDFEDRRRRHGELVRELDEIRRNNKQLIKRISVANRWPPDWRDVYKRLLIG
jgi:hypothetical protein